MNENCDTIITTQNINILYNSVFHRDADAEGSQYWIGKNILDFLTEVQSSPEFKAYDPLYKAAKQIEGFGRGLVEPK